MPIIDDDGNIGYYAWECAEQYTWLGFDRSRKMKYQITDQDIEEIDKRFTYHKPKEDQPERYTLLRNSAKAHAELIMQCVPPGRERAVALTQLEDSVMWANAGIARNE